MSERGLVDADKVWALLGKRWTLAILQRLDMAGVLRFTELKRSLDGISGTMLSERLLELECEGLITKKVYSSIPPKVEYSLTAGAEELVVLMRQVCTWNARWTSRNQIYEMPNRPAKRT